MTDSDGSIKKFFAEEKIFFLCVCDYILGCLEQKRDSGSKNEEGGFWWGEKKCLVKHF
jgi:hypothetical protein